MTNEVGPNGRLGHCVVTLSEPIGPMRLPDATMLLAVFHGEITVEVRGEQHVLGPAERRVIEPGSAWRLSPRGAATVLVVAAPPGPDQLVSDLATGAWTDPVARLTAALEAGVELLL